LAILLMSGGSIPVAAGPVPFSSQWTGTPSAPQPYRSGTDWSVVIHDRDATQTWSNPYPFDAQHGADCRAFAGADGLPQAGGTHPVTTSANEVFICNNHLMTGINGQGYGEITLTPSHLVDWSAGTTSITWHQSTLRTSCRDWLSFNLIPFANDLLLTDGIGVDLAKEPRNELMFSTGAACPSAFTGQDIRNFNGTDLGGSGAVEDVVPQSANTRSRFELDISSTHVRFGMPDQNLWFVDRDLASPLPYSQAVFQIEQHSYTPDKQCNPTPTFCFANTWHWSDFTISNSVPFTMLNGDAYQVSQHTESGLPSSVNLPGPIPANSFLRMEALAAPGSLRVSPDGGRTWTVVNREQVSQDNPIGRSAVTH